MALSNIACDEEWQITASRPYLFFSEGIYSQMSISPASGWVGGSQRYRLRGIKYQATAIFNQPRIAALASQHACLSEGMR